MRWHYVTGVVFGVFTLTWAFSGLLSMEPFAWTNARGLEVRRDVFTGGAVDLASFTAMKPAEWEHLVNGRGIKEIEFVTHSGRALLRRPARARSARPRSGPSGCISRTTSPAGPRRIA